MPEELIHEGIKSVYADLRKADQTRYRGDSGLAVRGALCSTGLFHKTVGGRWCLKEDTLRVLMLRFKERSSARRGKQQLKTAGVEGVGVSPGAGAPKLARQSSR